MGEGWEGGWEGLGAWGRAARRTRNVSIPLTSLHGFEVAPHGSASGRSPMASNAYRDAARPASRSNPPPTAMLAFRPLGATDGAWWAGRATRAGEAPSKAGEGRRAAEGRRRAGEGSWRAGQGTPPAPDPPMPRRAHGIVKSLAMGSTLSHGVACWSSIVSNIVVFVLNPVGLATGRCRLNAGLVSIHS